MRTRLSLMVLLLAVAALATLWEQPGPPDRGAADPAAANVGLPAEAADTLRLIERRGPFPHRQDGTVFQNRERLLPNRPHGYYREFTVRTPGARDRGARRIVTGGDPPEVFYYTEDHYRSFREIEGPR